jgi:hypothetical protein
MQITISGSGTMHAVAQDDVRRVLLLGTRVANHDVFERCRRLLQRSAEPVRLEQFSAAGLRRAWSASGTLAVLNTGWDLVLMMEDAPRIAAEPERYAAIARVLSFAARSCGARVALVQPPPWSGGADEWPRVRDAVAAAARAAYAAIVPVGVAWRRALVRRPDLPLGDGDGGITDLGAYLAACALARYVADDPVPALELPGVPRGFVGVVHRAVEDALTGVRDERSERSEREEGVQR